MRAPGRWLLLALAALALLAVPQGALAQAETPEPGEEEEIEELAKQPARVLLQQAIALLEIRDDEHEAEVRLLAALESRDQEDVDVAVLREAAETLEGGDAERAVTLIDAALSRPLGAASGKALHGAGREFRPATGAQEIVAVAAGAAALLLGLVGLWAGRRRLSAAGG